MWVLQRHSRGRILPDLIRPQGTALAVRRKFMPKVVLTRKLADLIDGIDIASYCVGDVLELSPSAARLLVAEKWAIPDRRRYDDGARVIERRKARPSVSATKNDHASRFPSPHR